MIRRLAHRLAEAGLAVHALYHRDFARVLIHGGAALRGRP